MRKGIVTSLILMATMFCTAQISTPSDGNDATNAKGSRAFTCGTTTVTDASGNVYNTVLIGDQCWMAENLKVGIMIDGSIGQGNNGIIEKHCYDNILSNCDTYGGLYQWNELMQYAGNIGAQGICPAGWHVPGYDEWQWLTYLIYGDTGGKLKTTGTIENGNGLWYAPNTLATNSSGFSAVPGGWKDDAGNFVNKGYYAFFFNSQGWWDCCAHFRQLSYNDANVNASWTYKSYSMSVRCLKSAPSLPIVTTSSISGITATTAQGGGNVTYDGGADVTARGVVWSTTQNPTVVSNAGITTDGTGTGVFTSNLTGLAPKTTYYVRAYATNSIGTGYGAEVEISTPLPINLALSGLIINTGTDTCFDATQTITVSNFTVKTSGSVTLIAGGNILLQPATKVEHGGYLHAQITKIQNYCLPTAAMLQTDSEKTTTQIQPTELQDASGLFSIFPNPTAGNFTLKMHDFNATQSIQVEISNMMGERELQTELSGRQLYEFDLTGWPAGIYLIRVIAGDKMSVGKLIRQ
ncbi:MAG: T9SS type A sorting domain-containing protein [Bacteroidetes bacterium]|nr:T9SS type A sorting domain-containing protein [Bacteroidota bacterium]